jgi:hypothetical protein
LASPALTGDLVIFDAIWGTIEDWQFIAFKDWALMRLNNDLDALKGKATDAQKEQYLREAPKLRGYYSTGRRGGSYKVIYGQLQAALDDWFKRHADEVGSYAGCLRENFNVDHPVLVSHEELMRGVKAGDPRGGKGSILDALKALDPKAVAAGGTCPPLPASAQPDKTPEKHPDKRKSRREGERKEEELPVGGRHGR